MQKKKSNHLSYGERILLEVCLSEGFSLTQIAAKMGRDRSTLVKEIKRNRYDRPMCKDEGIPKFETKMDEKNEYCPKLTKGTYVCNMCEKRNFCCYKGFWYNAEKAEQRYRHVYSVSRRGVRKTPEELEKMDSIVSERIVKGQPLQHIYYNHICDLNCSLQTIYNYIDKGVLSVCNLDLRHRVKYPCKKEKREEKISIRHGRTYNDLKIFLKNSDFSFDSIIEMDTIRSAKKDKSAILTIYIKECKLMLGFFLRECNHEHVCNTLDMLEDRLGTELFNKLFPVILTDNGDEFIDAERMETGKTGTNRTRIFYCDYNSPKQKAGCERNHRLIRYFYPPYYPLSLLCQDNIEYVVNNINSMSRKSLGGKSAYEIAEIKLGEDLIKKLGLKKIHPDDINIKEENVMT